MTEAEWLSVKTPSLLLRHLRPLSQTRGELRSWFARDDRYQLPRRWRLFLAASCRRVLPVLAPTALKVAETALRFTDEAPTPADLEDLVRGYRHTHRSRERTQLTRLMWGLTSPLASAAGELRNIVGAAAYYAADDAQKKIPATQAALRAEAKVHCDLIRDLFGNPFRPVEFDTVWRTPEVLGVARYLYEGHCVEGLPILADALEEAGCYNAEILAHLRSPGPHVRGCWALDLILSKDR